MEAIQVMNDHFFNYLNQTQEGIKAQNPPFHTEFGHDRMFGVDRRGGVEKTLTVSDLITSGPRRVPQLTEAGVAVHDLHAGAGVGETSSEHLEQEQGYNSQ